MEADHYRAAAMTLMGMDESELLMEGARRLAGIRRLPTSAGELAEPGIEAMGLSESVSAVLLRLARRTNKELHELVCGDAYDEQDDRQKLRDAFNIGDEAFASAVIAAVIGYCGLSPAIAVPIAVIIVKRIGKPAFKELCAVWSETLGT